MKMKINKKFIIAILIFIVILMINGTDNIIEFFKPSSTKNPVIERIKNKLTLIFNKNRIFTGNLEPLNHRDILNEITLSKGNKSYTINKKEVYLCLNDENGNTYDENMLMYVTLHELAHIINTKNIGHTTEFDNIFEELLDLSIEKGIYDPNKPIIQNYCKY